MPAGQTGRLDAIARVTGAIAHDMNNIIMLVNGYADLLLSRTPADDPRRSDAEAIMAAGQRAAALTAQLLIIGRRRRLRPEIVDVNGFLEEKRARLQEELGPDISLEYQLEPDAGQIKVDREQMEWVLLELARNARTAMPQGGSVIVSARRSGAHVLLEFRDTGAGIDAAGRERLFEPFYTTKPKGVAVGLGLATIWAVVTGGGGEIAIDSEPGRGAAVLIRLPQSV
jgi:signal transduction histidine kinase